MVAIAVLSLPTLANGDGPETLDKKYCSRKSDARDPIRCKVNDVEVDSEMDTEDLECVTCGSVLQAFASVRAWCKLHIPYHFFLIRRDREELEDFLKELYEQETKLGAEQYCGTVALGKYVLEPSSGRFGKLDFNVPTGNSWGLGMCWVSRMNDIETIETSDDKGTRFVRLDTLQELPFNSLERVVGPLTIRDNLDLTSLVCPLLLFYGSHRLTIIRS